MKTNTNTKAKVISFKRNMFLVSAALILSMFLLYLWSALAPLESASIASGFIRAQSDNVKIEHIDGGRIKSIQVGNGDLVRSGDVLLELDTRDIQSSLAARLNEYLIILAQRDKAKSLLSANTEVEFAGDTLAIATKLNKESVLQAQELAFSSSKQVKVEQQQLLESRMQQLEKGMAADKSRLESLAEQYKLVKTELASYEKLADKHHIGRIQLVGLQREKARIKGESGVVIQALQEKKLNLGALKLESQHLTSQEREQAANILTRLEQSIPQLEDKIQRSKDLLRNAIILAPVDGVITEMQINSTGETIKAGEVILKILPVEDELIAIARLETDDIDSVQQGQAARVRLLAYNFRTTPPLEATVNRISADRLEDRFGYYYEVELKINKQALSQHTDINIRAGMPVEGIILNGSRTMLDYIIEPVKRSISRSLRET